MAKLYGNNAHNGNAQLKREYDEKNIEKILVNNFFMCYTNFEFNMEVKK